ncbi:DUF4372 domain-containing protein [Sphingobacterium endophyticum]|uniref:DUF4372 domain-containing protein n=1 Tax=Sphingobacterium endophyticum TaxID=2546448 RepID=UPI0037448947
MINNTRSLRIWFLSIEAFSNRLVQQYQSHKHYKGISSLTYFVAMLFCHLPSISTGNMNLMDISRNPAIQSFQHKLHSRQSPFQDLYYRLLDLLWK